MGTHFFDATGRDYLGWVPVEKATPGPRLNVPADALAVPGEALRPDQARGDVRLAPDRGGIVVDLGRKAKRERFAEAQRASGPLVLAIARLVSKLSLGEALTPEEQALAMKLAEVADDGPAVETTDLEMGGARG